MTGRADDARVGTTVLGVWRVVRAIGAGGMGAVYEVEHLITHARRALKVMHANRREDAAAVSRLLREAAVTRGVKSPHVVQTLSTGVLEDGSSYLMMELLAGRSLAERLDAEGRLPVREVVRLGGQIARGLAAAHAAGVVHRDLTPGNIFLVRHEGQEHAKIVDFGLSKHVVGMTDRFGHLTKTGAFVGTPYYVSPEQASGRRVDERADQYGLAVILYECLCGDRPYAGDSLLEVLGRIASGEHLAVAQRRPEVGDQLSRSISKAMRLDPERRYPDVLTFVGHLALEHGQAMTMDGFVNTAAVPVPVSAVPVARDLAEIEPSSTGALPARQPSPHRSGGHAAVVQRRPRPARTGPGKIIGLFVLVLLFGAAVLGVAFVATSYVMGRRPGAVSPPLPTPREPLPESLSPRERASIETLRTFADRQEFGQCLALGWAMPRSASVIEAQIECAQRGHLDRDGLRVCQDLLLRYPSHPTILYCRRLLEEDMHRE